MFDPLPRPSRTKRRYRGSDKFQVSYNSYLATTPKEFIDYGLRSPGRSASVPIPLEFMAQALPLVDVSVHALKRVLSTATPRRLSCFVLIQMHGIESLVYEGVANGRYVFVQPAYLFYC